MEMINNAHAAFDRNPLFHRPPGFRAALPANRRIDPYDQLVAAYPPLSRHPCYVVIRNRADLGRLPQITCAESVLGLALTVLWTERFADKPADRRPVLDVLHAAAPMGMSIAQMIRRVMHIGLSDFPIYRYDVAANFFTLLHGKPRKDKWSIVFVPADGPGGFPVAHWTFTTVNHEDAPVLVNARPPVVMYSTLPPDPAPALYWRAKVLPENLGIYEKHRAAGRACDCNWATQCSHEDVFRNLPWLVRPIRICLEEDVIIQGVLRAQLAGIITKGRVRQGAHGRVTYHGADGAEISQLHLHDSQSLSVCGIWQNLKRVARNNKLTETELLHTVDVAPYRLDCWRIPDCDECRTDYVMDFVSSAAMGLLSSTFGDGMRTQLVSTVEVVEPALGWAHWQDLTLVLPRVDELLNRLACRGELTKDNVMDTVRRLAADERWDIDISRPEFKDWLERTVTEIGMATPLTLDPASCWTCMQRKKTKWHKCRDCARKHRSHPMEPVSLWDTLVAHVGMRPIWSKDYKLPPFTLKQDVVVMRRIRRRAAKDDYETLISGDGTGTYTLPQLLAYLTRLRSPRTMRGHLSGPMFLGLEPTCFPRGEATAVEAFLVRLGAARLHQAREDFYDLVFQVALPFLSRIEPESEECFLSHFKGLKLQKNLDAQTEVNDGWFKPPTDSEHGAKVDVRMTSFPKSEKSNTASVKLDGYLADKAEEKPRSICSPEPMVLFRLGRYTHAQTKWMARKFSWKKQLYYAGCADPESLNKWLNYTLSEIPEPWSLVDDISAIDANHSRESFAFHTRVRNHQFPQLDKWIAAAFLGEALLRVRAGAFRMMVEWVNASGVSDTSYKNSLICLFVRLLAIAHALQDLNRMSQDEVVSYVEQVRREVRITASGDDGLTRLGNVVAGIDIHQFSIDRYREAWSWAGFDVKVAMVPPNRWRMATYLAMRPVWAGTRYEWAPEPARRARNMFWQFECPLHPVAWARGIARQVLQQARHVPFLRQLCDWFLHVAKGPTAWEGDRCRAVHEYSAFYGLASSGDMNPRAISEFCLDYHVTMDDISLFERILASTTDPYVNIDCHLVRRIFAEES